MDQTQQLLRGDFYAPKNRYAKTDNAPHFKGTICKPGSDAKIPIAAWVGQYADPRTGEVKTYIRYTLGDGPTTVPAHEQLLALAESSARGEAVTVGKSLELAGHQGVTFPNGFKDEAPEKKRPNQWGWVNPGDGTPPFQLSVWFQTFEDGHAYLSGRTQYPDPSKSIAQQQDAELEALIAQDTVTRGMPKKKAKGGRGE